MIIKCKISYDWLRHTIQKDSNNVISSNIKLSQRRTK